MRLNQPLVFIIVKLLTISQKANVYIPFTKIPATVIRETINDINVDKF